MPNSIPDFATFKQLHANTSSATQRAVIPVFRRLMSDTLTPVLAYRRLVRPDDRMAPSFLLESVIGGQNAGRYSYMGARPICEVVAKANTVEIRDHLHPQNSRTFESENPLHEVHKITDSWKLAQVSGLPKFSGGWVGYAGYDTARYVEKQKLASPPQDDRGLPDIHMQLYTDLIAFDHVSKTVLVMTHVLGENSLNLEQAYAQADATLDQLIDLLTTPWQPERGATEKDSSKINTQEVPTGHVDLAAPPRQLTHSNMGAGGYQSAVDKCKKYIEAGDIFQAVPSQRFELSTRADPFDIYRALRVVNPSPYMFYLQAQGAMLVGSSPEILCKVSAGVVTNRPLAGTRRRGCDSDEDKALEQELRDDPKDKAEHIMLVDLGRNDVGKIAQKQSVKLEKIMDVERFSHVMHLSSTITGQLRQGLTCWDALAATLPAGTLSGAPKIRAMQIIDELEPTRRGPYGGAVGCVDFKGNMDMAIVLRTMVILPGQDGQWKIYVQAGAGIVADSDPDSEHQETVHKAAALAKAVDVAEAAFLE